MPPLLVMMPQHEEVFESLGIKTFSQLFDSGQASDELKCEALALFQPEGDIAA